MRYLNNILRVAASVAIVILFAMCTKDTELVDQEIGLTGDYTTCQANINLLVASVKLIGDDPVSRAADVDSDDDITSAEIKNIWVIQTNGSKVIYFPQYVEDFSSESIIDVSMTSDGTTESTFYIVANTFDPAFGDKISINTTIENLQSYTMEIAQENDCFGYDETTGEYHYILSGTQVAVVEDGFALSATLSANIAKVNFSIVNSAGLYVKSVQIVDVPNCSRYFPIDENEDIYPAQSSLKTISYEEEVAGADGDIDFSWYMPVNRRGNFADDTYDGVTAKNKPQYAPEGSTYIKVELVQDYDDKQAIYTYRFYLGEDMISDFNISANCCYNCTVTLSNSELTQYDYRVESATIISDFTDSAEVANCYMLSPEQSSTQAALVSAVEMKKIFYIPVVERINEYWGDILSHGDDIFVEILWSDVSTDELSVEVTHTTPSSTVAYTAMMVTMPESFNHGNVTVGVKDSDGGLLWSWHLWITDYSPIGDMMDRAIGYIDNRGLYYQYGRKDPFSSLTTVVHSQSTIVGAIQSPTTFFAPIDSNNWIMDEDEAQLTWCDTDGAKSIFDPSPFGWKIPDSDTLESSVTSLDLGYIGTDGYADDLGALWSCNAYVYEYSYTQTSDDTEDVNDSSDDVTTDEPTTVTVIDDTSYAEALVYDATDIYIEKLSPRLRGYQVISIRE